MAVKSVQLYTIFYGSHFQLKRNVFQVVSREELDFVVDLNTSTFLLALQKSQNIDIHVSTDVSAPHDLDTV